MSKCSCGGEFVKTAHHRNLIRDIKDGSSSKNGDKIAGTKVYPATSHALT